MPASDKVWIVDDDRSIRWVLEKALMQEGLEATAFLITHNAPLFSRGG